MPCESQYQVLSRTGIQMAVQCKDQSLHVVDIPDGKEQTIFSAEQRANTSSPVYSQDGHWLAVGFEDGGDTHIRRHVAMANFTADGKYVLAGGADSRITVVVRKNSVRAGFRVDVTLLHRNRVLVFDFLRSTG